MRRLAIVALAVLFASSSADAYWFWPLPNPEMAPWYAAYTGVYQGQIIIAVSPSQRGQAMADLRTIIQQYPPTQLRVVQVANTGNLMRDYISSKSGPFGPGDEAKMILEAMGGGFTP